MNDKEKRGKIIDDLLTENPTTPKRTLARMAIDAHPDLFTSIKQARNLILYRTGCSGKANRKKRVRTDTRFFNHKSIQVKHDSDGQFTPKILLFDIETTPVHRS